MDRAPVGTLPGQFVYELNTTIMPTEIATTTYKTLEEIRLRKEQLSNDIEADGEKIAAIWNELTHKKEDASKGEYIATLVSNSVTAIDAFLLMRKLMKNYSGVLKMFGLRRDRKKR